MPVGLEVQPVLVLVNVKVAVPAAIPLTVPEFETVAIAELLLAHVPPTDGDREVCELIQIDVGPVKNTTGLS
jgi:hypothetical protein